MDKIDYILILQIIIISILLYQTYKNKFLYKSEKFDDNKMISTYFDVAKIKL